MTTNFNSSSVIFEEQGKVTIRDHIDSALSPKTLGECHMVFANARS